MVTDLIKKYSLICGKRLHADFWEWQVARFLKCFAMLFQLLLRFPQINELTASIRMAIPPMLWAGAIVLIISSLYAVIGVYFFSSASPEEFGDFFPALFTMFQIMTGDKWSSGIVRPLFETPQAGQYRPLVALFFVSFFLIVPMVRCHIFSLRKWETE
jgi:voltage-gated sodium channel